MSRTPISQRRRFAIFERDCFACRYCGKTAEDTLLEVDHVVPVSAGGGDEEENLITACVACNRGKSASHLNEPHKFKPLTEAQIGLLRAYEICALIGGQFISKDIPRELRGAGDLLVAFFESLCTNEEKRAIGRLANDEDCPI